MEREKLGKYVDFLWIILIISLPWSKALSSISMVLILILSLEQIKELWPKIRSYRVISVFMLLFLLLLPGLFSSSNLNQGLSFVYKQVGYLVLPALLLLHIPRIKKQGALLIQYFIKSCTVASICTLILFLIPEALVIQLSETVTLLKPYEKTIDRISFGMYSPFIDRLHFSYLLVIGLMWMVWMHLKNLRKMAWYFATAMLITLILLGGRGAQLGFIIVLMVWAFAFILDHPKLMRKRKYLIPAVILLALLIPYGSYHTVPPVKKRYDQLIWELKLVRSGEYKQWNYEHFTSLRRLLSLKHHFELIRTSPWLGSGVGDYRDELQNSYDRDASIGLNLTANANNQYLFYWANAGILALLMYLFVFYYWARGSLRASTALLDKGLIWSFLLFFVFISIFDVFMIYQIGIMSFTIFGGLIYILIHNQKKEVSE